MTLEERLQRRLQLWRAAAKQHRDCMDELNEQDEEWTMHRLEAEVFERVVAELCVDLSARSTATPTRAKTKLPAEYYRR